MINTDWFSIQHVDQKVKIVINSSLVPPFEGLNSPDSTLCTKIQTKTLDWTNSILFRPHELFSVTSVAGLQTSLWVF